MTTSQFIIEKLLHVCMDYPLLLWPIGNIPNWVFFLYSQLAYTLKNLSQRRRSNHGVCIIKYEEGIINLQITYEVQRWALDGRWKSISSQLRRPKLGSSKLSPWYYYHKLYLWYLSKSHTLQLTHHCFSLVTLINSPPHKDFSKYFWYAFSKTWNKT